MRRSVKDLPETLTTRFECYKGHRSTAVEVGWGHRAQTRAFNDWLRACPGHNGQVEERPDAPDGSDV
jgi:hypothetical protein